MPTFYSLYQTIWRATARSQYLLIVLSVIVAVLAAVPLKFQQLVINSIVEHSDVTILAWLCFGFFASLLLGGIVKFALYYKRSVLGERAIHLIRDRLYANYVKESAVDTGSMPKRGALVTMLTSEAEAVGSFAGNAISEPLMLFGTLVSVLGFIVVSEPWLGVMAIVVTAPQVFIVAAIQRRINARVGERVQVLRDASDRILESDFKELESRIVDDFNQMFEIRKKIIFLTQSIKFVLRAMSAVGAVGFLFLGGWLVIAGKTDVGTVVASLTGLARIEQIWRDLVACFRTASIVRVQFAMLLTVIAPVQGGPAERTD
jgi:ABC-type bacteriocin/lantibiotic exporter with double-glycine peptidase domain